SKAAPSGVCGLPRASRKRALRSVSSGQPNCSARLAAMALSRAHASAWLPHLWFEMKISPTQPSSKREYVHAYRSLAFSKLKVSLRRRSGSRWRRLMIHLLHWSVGVTLLRYVTRYVTPAVRDTGAVEVRSS